MNKTIGLSAFLLMLSGSVHAYPAMSPFDMADTDRSSDVSQSEYMKFAGQEYEITLSLDYFILDKNSDRAITAAEFEKYAPFGKENSLYFKKYSSDGKTLSMDDYRKMRQLGIQANSSKLLWQFAEKDIDMDGKLSMDEFNGVAKIDVKPALDTDGDGIPDHLDDDKDGNGVLDQLEGKSAETMTSTTLIKRAPVEKVF